MSVKIKFPLTATWLDYPDNHSIAVSVYFYGCDFDCPDCHNPELRVIPPDAHEYFCDLLSVYDQIVRACDKFQTDKVVLCGGDPLADCNIEFTKELLKRLNSFSVCLYTGYGIERFENSIYNTTDCVKFIKTGTFDKTQKLNTNKTDDMMIFASKNQELYNESLKLLSKDGIYYFNKQERNKHV